MKGDLTPDTELNMNLIEIKRLNKAYESGDECVLALVEVELNIDRGEFISVMGPSVSVKSSLLTSLGGLNHPTKGDVVVDDIPIYKLSLEKLADFRREYLGFIFQSFQLIPYLTVIENVMLPLSITERSNREQVRMAEEIMELFKSLNSEGQTIIMVTHNPENVAFSSRTISLRDGRVANGGED